MEALTRHLKTDSETRKRISAEVDRLLTHYREHSIAEPMAGGAQNLMMTEPGSQTQMSPLFELPATAAVFSSTNQLPRPLHMNSLPMGVRLSLLSWLPAEDVGRMSRVSRDWAVPARDELLWASLLRRDLRRWDRVSADRDPDAFRAAYPNISSKAIYAWCRPARASEASSVSLGMGVGLSALVSLMVGHKPRVVMFGPGLDSRTSKLVRSILADPGRAGNDLSRFKVTGMVPGAVAGMGSGISLRFAEHNFNLVTLYSNTKSVRQGLNGHNRVQDNKLFTHMGEVYQLAPSIQELCRRSAAFVFVVDATRSAAEIAESASELSAVCCNLWSAAAAPLLVLACSRGTWSPSYDDVQPLPPIDVARALRLGRLNRRWTVQAGEVETLHGVRSGFQWLLSNINPVHSFSQPR